MPRFNLAEVCDLVADARAAAEAELAYVPFDEPGGAAYRPAADVPTPSVRPRSNTKLDATALALAVDLAALNLKLISQGHDALAADVQAIMASHARAHGWGPDWVACAIVANRHTTS